MDDPEHYLKLLGTEVEVLVDRPIGTVHPDIPTLTYHTNYGYIPGTMAGDGEEIDAYILGVYYPIQRFVGRCIAVILRRDDDEHKMVVAKSRWNAEMISKQTAYIEHHFDTQIIVADRGA